MIITRRALIRTVGLVFGVGLLVVTLARADLRSLAELAWQLGPMLPLTLVPGALWHVVRTRAWRVSFPPGAQPKFGRLFRVRLAAEAFSFVTVRGVGGEPLKVALLEEVEPTLATASVALERIAYVFTTMLIVGVAAVGTLMTTALSDGWRRVFVALAVAGMISAAVPLLFSLRRRRAHSSSSARVPASSSGAIVRFLRALDAQCQTLVRDDRGRFAQLVWLETLAFGAMAMEVWVVLWAARTPITIMDAMSVETFTRIASMASAFIPANLGALEASNVAVVTAIHAAGGAAALALVRRLRGLLWCAAGFLIYPRDGARGRASPSDASRVLVVIEPSISEVKPSDRLGGLPIGERIVRAAARAAYGQVLVWTPDQPTLWQSLAARFKAVPTTAIANPAEWRAAIERLNPSVAVTVLGPGVIASPQLLAAAHAIVPPEGALPIEVAAGAEWPQSGVFRVMPRQLLDPSSIARGARREDTATAFDRVPSGRDVAQGALRLANLPARSGQAAFLSVRVTTMRELQVAERRLRESIFKPTDANLARFNRLLSIPLSVALVRWTRFSPHAMSIGLVGLGLYAGWLFSRGSYGAGVAAAVLSLVASILDGCDGELARLQYRESAFGTWLDTLGDYVYYVAIFGGIAIGVARQSDERVDAWMGVALILGMMMAFALLILLRSRLPREHPERLRATTRAHFELSGRRWAWLVAHLSVCATRATMPYGVLAFALIGRLQWLLALGALGAQIYWISLAIELRPLLKRHGAGQTALDHGLSQLPSPVVKHPISTR
jgi:phosphatidylglycerophosphate synthase